jgi:hypothetical protein
VHANAGHHLEQVEHAVALAQAVEEQRDGAQLDAAGAEEDEVAVDPVQLGEPGADPLRPLRHLDLDQPLDRAHVSQLVREEGQVVHPRRVGDALPVGLLLEVLLEAGVDVSDVGVQANHHLAVQRHDQAQHAVGGRVVRAEVDGDQILALGRVDLAGGGAGHLRRLPQRHDRGGCVLGRRHQTASVNWTTSPPIG